MPFQEIRTRRFADWPGFRDRALRGGHGSCVLRSLASRDEGVPRGTVFRLLPRPAKRQGRLSPGVLSPVIQDGDRNGNRSASESTGGIAPGTAMAVSPVPLADARKGRRHHLPVSWARSRAVLGNRRGDGGTKVSLGKNRPWKENPSRRLLVSSSRMAESGRKEDKQAGMRYNKSFQTFQSATP